MSKDIETMRAAKKRLGFTDRTPTPEDIRGALAALNVSLVQLLPSDDRIIAEHICDAYILLGGSVQGHEETAGASATSSSPARTPEWWATYNAAITGYLSAMVPDDDVRSILHNDAVALADYAHHGKGAAS